MDAGDRFARRVSALRIAPLRATSLDVLQINVGKRCNQACKHCHVDAGPARTEVMAGATLDACLEAVRRLRLGVVDITGGAPELHPEFRRLVREARAAGARVIVRHNLTVMFEAGQEDLPELFAAEGVELVSSLPHYLAAATDRQRGLGVHQLSVAALRRLNGLGFGTGRRDRPLDLMFNPGGAFLPGPQAALEADFKRELARRHGVTFDRLLALTNMPIRRFRDWLEKTDQLATYQQTLEAAFNPATLASLMCRSMLSVAWDGRLHDCDFNQMLALPLDGPRTIFELDEAALAAIAARRIVTGEHCFGCTAGAGSSCGGALG
jgi:radical SAM/Cys-rich protein